MRTKGIVFTTSACVAALLVWRVLHAPAKPVFKTAPVEQGEIQSIVTATGTTSPLVTVDVGTQVSGIITALYADFESKVRKGQLLAEIDPRQFQQNVEIAQATVNSAQAALAAAQAAVRAADASITAARDDSERYKALAAVFASTEQRFKVALDREEELKDIVSQDDVATARAAYDAAAADSVGAGAQQQISVATVDEKIAEFDEANNKVEVAKSQLKQAETGLQQAQVNLEHTRITSPIDGVVLNLEVSVGQTVAASTEVPVLFQIAQDLDTVEVDVDVDESDVSRVQAGQSAIFDVDAFPRVTFDATVRTVRKDATIVSGVVTYAVVLDVLQPPVQLFPGMTTNVHILSADHPNAIKIPNAALRFHPLDTKPPAKVGGQTPANSTALVYVLDSGGKPAARKILPGISDGYYTEMLSGDLHAGDALIVSETLAS